MVAPYLEARQRQLLYQEAVLAFLGVGGEAADQPATSHAAAYCKACKAAHLGDCATCNPAAITVH